MQLAFLRQSLADRQLHFEQAAFERRMHPAVLEKDFWVCWLLAIAFGDDELGDSLLFKGGTALSKVFRVIERFSEDLDLGIEPKTLGISEAEVERAPSRTQRDRWMKRLQDACAEVVRERFQPALERGVVEVLGPREGGAHWLEFVTDDASHSPVLFFHYPTTQAEGFPYLRRAVKLEFGSLTDQRPLGRHPVQPWIAEVLPAEFEDWRCEVVALELERTFWEKATILHAEFHRPPGDRLPERYARHYSDVAALARHPAVGSALADHDLRERVVVWKGHFFARSWARYDLARPGSFRLVPEGGHLSELRADYVAMRHMFLSEPPVFEEVLETLAELEQRINAG